MNEAASPAVDPNKKILIPYPLSSMFSLENTTSFNAYAKFPTMQIISDSAGPTLPSKGNIIVNIAIAQATA